MPVKVKICGITNPQDAVLAVEAGADAVGLNFYEQSPRYITLSTAADIVESLPPFIIKVGVFVNPSPELVQRSIAECDLNMLQFHGAETPDFCRQFGLMSIKAFRIQDENSLRALTEYQTDAWLLDAFTPGKLGGTGERFNWDLAVQACQMGRPIFLAGGLTPENVSEAVQKVRPYAVDVSSGVELSPGRKDKNKLLQFVRSAKQQSID